MIKTTTKHELIEKFGEIELTFKGSEPFIVNDEGYPLGVLIARVSDGKVLCFICSKWWEHLSCHLKLHKMSVYEYKRKYGFNRQAGLVSRSLSEKISDNQKKSYQKRKAEGKKLQSPPEFKARKDTKTAMQMKNGRGTCPAQYVARYLAVASEIGKEPTAREMDKLDPGVRHFSKKFGRKGWIKFQEAVLKLATS